MNSFYEQKQEGFMIEVPKVWADIIHIAGGLQVPYKIKGIIYCI